MEDKNVPQAVDDLDTHIHITYANLLRILSDFVLFYSSIFVSLVY